MKLKEEIKNIVVNSNYNWTELSILNGRSRNFLFQRYKRNSLMTEDIDFILNKAGYKIEIKKKD